MKTNLHPSPHDIPPLRFLLDSCLYSPYCVWLGGAVSLLNDNHKFGVNPVQPLGSSSIFHAGTIGAGARGSPAQHPVSEDQAEINRRTVAGVIMRLCEGMGEQQGEGPSSSPS